MYKSPEKSNTEKRLLAGKKSKTPGLKGGPNQPATKDMFDNSVPEDNPFQTMYQRTIGSTAQHTRQRPQTADKKVFAKVQQDGKLKTADSAANLSPYLAPNRRFG